MNIVSSENIKEIDRICEEKYNIPTLILMENAGKSIFSHISSNIDINKNIAVVCGKGNNGGDGLVCARHLINNNYNVTIYLLGEPSTKDCKTNLSILESIKAKIIFITKDNLPNFKEYDIIIDALLGIGIKGAPKDLFSKVINAINSASSYIYSIDIPSGINGTTGEGVIFIKANETLTLGYPKIGSFVFPGREACGKVTTLDISLPKDILDNIESLTHAFTKEDFQKPERFANSHKGTYGHVGIIGGLAYMTGAATLTGLASYGVGCGYVSIASPIHYMSSFSNKLTEAVITPIYKSNEDSYSQASIPELISFTKSKSVVVLGPGLGKNETSIDIVSNICNNSQSPLILDADAIYGISYNLDKLKPNTVLTPHPKEMTYLTGLNIGDIQKNRIKIAKEFAKKYNIILVLKGADTVTTDGKEVYINTSGSDGMATAGSGDVLSGIIAGLIAQKGVSLKTVASAVWLHGKAGEEAQKALGFGMRASNIIEYIKL
ncbi:MAG: NAD(P)H-hydrate dehydratase [Abditibacteriota bacterium]|nr:NAD(P)H-hydrate dehydratase [Abditibacteriota bacterium]